ncbi:hypothetical protein D3C71_1549860 [compost metagenome]
MNQWVRGSNHQRKVELVEYPVRLGEVSAAATVLFCLLAVDPGDGVAVSLRFEQVRVDRKQDPHRERMIPWYKFDRDACAHA